jgi:hypothetical protein
MKSLEQIWLAIELAGERGGARRVDEDGDHDFYASVSLDSRRGLLLLSDSEAPAAPAFDAVEVVSSQRADGRWLTSIWLKTPALSRIFAELCDSLLDAARGIASEHVPTFVISRLYEWQQLLESASRETLSPLALRALVGELIVMRHCLSSRNSLDVVAAWMGPLHAAHYFVLADASLEVKTTARPSAAVRINSIEQLDVPDNVNLLLVVVALATPVADGDGAFSPQGLVMELRGALADSPQALSQFDYKMQSAGFADHVEYERLRFRILSYRVFAVKANFPRLRRVSLPLGLVAAAYDISIGSCEQFEQEGLE